MEAKLRLAPFVVWKDCVRFFWMCASGKFNQSGLKELILFRANFDKKKRIFEIFSHKFQPKKVNQRIKNTVLKI